MNTDREDVGANGDAANSNGGGNVPPDGGDEGGGDASRRPPERNGCGVGREGDYDGGDSGGRGGASSPRIDSEKGGTENDGDPATFVLDPPQLARTDLWAGDPADYTCNRDGLGPPFGYACGGGDVNLAAMQGHGREEAGGNAAKRSRDAARRPEGEERGQPRDTAEDSGLGRGASDQGSLLGAGRAEGGQPPHLRDRPELGGAGGGGWGDEFDDVLGSNCPLYAKQHTGGRAQCGCC